MLHFVFDSSMSLMTALITAHWVNVFRDYYVGIPKGFSRGRWKRRPTFLSACHVPGTVLSDAERGRCMHTRTFRLEETSSLPGVSQLLKDGSPRPQSSRHNELFRSFI